MGSILSFVLAIFCIWNVVVLTQRHDVVEAFVPATSSATRRLSSPWQTTSKCITAERSYVRERYETWTLLQAAVSPSLTTSRPIQTAEKVAYIIEELPKQPNENVYKEISQMCIGAFFNDGGRPDRKIPFWKEWQLGYLRTLQQSDLRKRRAYYPTTNFMLVARQVLPATRAAARRTPLILDLSQVYNLDVLQPTNAEDYCRGPILGFVEVTQRPYGIGGEFKGIVDNIEDGRRFQKSGYYAERPILTNLSVKYEARQSGVGSRLLEQCEQIVQSRWNMNEIILEVEDDNTNALRFYEKRGYKVLFEDPASRRYDTNGLVLRQLRCRRKIMRKMLSNGLASMEMIPDVGLVNRSFVTKAWQRIKDSVRF